MYYQSNDLNITTEVGIVNTTKDNKEKTKRRERFEKQRKDGEFEKPMAGFLKNIYDSNDKGNWEIKGIY
jgi:predicted RNA-binding protein with RPS1 domain